MLPWMILGFALGPGEVAVFKSVAIDCGENGPDNLVKLLADGGGGLWLPSGLFCFFEQVKEYGSGVKPGAMFTAVEAMYLRFFMNKEMQFLMAMRARNPR